MKFTIRTEVPATVAERATVQDPFQDPDRPGGPLLALDGTPRPAVADTANPNVKRDAKGRLLPGQSLNPGGRKAGLKQILDEVVDIRRVLEVVASIAYGPLAPAARMNDRLKAAELLLAYKFGKPHQTLDVNEKQPTSINPRELSSERLHELRSTIRKSITGITDAEIVEE